MAAIGEIRKRSWLLVVVIVIGMLAFILGDMINSRGGSVEQSIVGEVNGEEITSLDYQELVDKEFEKTNVLFRVLARKDAPSSEKERINKSFMSQYLNQQMFQAQYDKIGITVTDEEFNDLIQGDNVDGRVYEQVGLFVDRNGKFSSDTLKKYISNYAQDPNFNEMLDKVIGDQAEKMQLQKKYFNMINNGMYTTSYEAKKEFETSNNTATFEYVYAPFSSVNLEEVSVSESEMKAYYNKHKDDKKYDQEDQVSFQFVEFAIEPSDEDLDIAKNYLVERVELFKEADNDTSFIINNSDTRNLDFSAATFPKELDSIVNNAENGQVIGPYKDGEFFKLAKVIKNGFKQEATVRHILLGNNVYRDAAAQNRRADSLVEALRRNPRNFPKAVEKFTTDLGSKSNGGKYEWFDDKQMVPEFTKVSFEEPIGTITQTRTTYGIHIIEVLGRRDTDKKELVVATVDSEIRRSKETINEVRDRALEFITSFERGEISDSAFDNAATKLGLTVKPMSNIKISVNEVPEFGSNFDQVKKWAFNKNTDKGEVSDELVFDKSVAVAHLLNRVESGIPEFENLDQKFKNNIESILMNEKKGEKLKEKMTGASLEEIAKNVSATVQTATNAKLDNTNIDGIGSEPAVVGTAFGLEANGISKPVVGETGVFVVRLKSMTPAPLPDNFDAQKNEITNRLRMPGGGATDRAFRTLTELSGLKDNREKVNILGN